MRRPRGKKKKKGKRKKKKSLRTSWSRRRNRWPWLLEDWGGFCATGFGKKKEFCCEEEPMQREVK